MIHWAWLLLSVSIAGMIGFLVGTFCATLPDDGGKEEAGERP